MQSQSGMVLGKLSCIILLLAIQVKKEKKETKKQDKCKGMRMNIILL